MEPHAGDIISVTLELQYRIGIRGFYIVEPHCEMTGRREEPLVGGDTEPVDLRVGMLNCARADTGECFPEPVRVR